MGRGNKKFSYRVEGSRVVNEGATGSKIPPCLPFSKGGEKERSLSAALNSGHIIPHSLPQKMSYTARFKVRRL
jgi:hypothetical protein